jgi:hypothetical protein
MRTIILVQDAEPRAFSTNAGNGEFYVKRGAAKRRRGEIAQFPG